MSAITSGSHSGRFQIIIVLCIFTPVIILLITFCWLYSGQIAEKQCSSTPAHVGCPASWLNYEGKCYFFSEEERSWASGQSFCTSSDSSMAVIKSEAEKVFILRYMSTTDHWIGVLKDHHQTWKWTDGTEFNHLLEVKGEIGDCAFLSTEHGFAMSSDCQIPRKWICSQPDAYTRSNGPMKGD